MGRRLLEWLELFGDAFREIRVHPLRSMLTLSGIVFGAASMVSMISLAGAVQRLASDDLKAIGLPRSFSFQDRAPQPDAVGAMAQRHPGLRMMDMQALASLEGVESVHGFNRAFMLTVGPVGRRNIDIEGVDAGYLELRNMQIVAGRSLRPLDILNSAPVAVVGQELVRDLFGAASPIGQTIKLNGKKFLVVGVVGPIEITFIPADFSFTARRIYIPYSYLTRYNRSPGRVDATIVTARPDVDFGTVFAAGVRVVRNRHGGAEDFRIENDAAEVLSDLAMADGILDGWNVVMFTIGGITLLVGGIGLFSVLLISVRERVREIGIRKALGADEGDILRLFLSESLTLAGLGAGIGVGAGMGLLIITELIVAKFGRVYTIPVNVPALIIAVVFSLLAGIIFGWYPARRAARLDPIEAISTM